MDRAGPNRVPVKVECHSGYKADEYPVFFYWKGERYEVSEIRDRWYQSDRDPGWPASDYFRVKTVDGGLFLLKHDLSEDAWYLCL
jgi:hypothetical protein